MSSLLDIFKEKLRRSENKLRVSSINFLCYFIISQLLYEDTVQQYIVLDRNLNRIIFEANMSHSTKIFKSIFGLFR